MGTGGGKLTVSPAFLAALELASLKDEFSAGFGILEGFCELSVSTNLTTFSTNVFFSSFASADVEDFSDSG